MIKDPALDCFNFMDNCGKETCLALASSHGSQCCHLYPNLILVLNASRQDNTYISSFHLLRAAATKRRPVKCPAADVDRLGLGEVTGRDSTAAAETWALVPAVSPIKGKEGASGLPTALCGQKNGSRR